MIYYLSILNQYSSINDVIHRIIRKYSEVFNFIATNAVMAALDHFRANSIYIWQLVRRGWRLINSVTGDHSTTAHRYVLHTGLPDIS